MLYSYECDINVALDLHTCRKMLFSSFIPDIDDLHVFSVNTYRFFFFSTVKERGVVKIKGYDSNTVTILGRNEGKSHLT